MERKHLAIPWGTRVIAPDGRSVRLQGAILAPRSDRISHLVVRHRLRSTATVRLQRASQARDGTVTLESRSGGREEDTEPRRGSVHFSAKSALLWSGGSRSHLQGFLLDQASNAVSALLVGSGRDPKVIAIDGVTNLRTGSPQFTGATDHGMELRGFPSYRPDDTAQSLAERALRDGDPTGGRAYEAVLLSEVHDGTAYLSGNVRISIQRAEVEEAVRRAPGVLDVQSDIATDEGIQMAAAESMAQAGLTHSGTVLVKSVLGRVTLAGTLSSNDEMQQAVDLAGAVAGVRRVVSNMGTVAVVSVGRPEPHPEQEGDGKAQESEEGEDSPSS